MEEEHPLIVSKAKIKNFLGPKKFTNQRLFEDEKTPSGITMSLATSIAFGQFKFFDIITL